MYKSYSKHLNKLYCIVGIIKQNMIKNPVIWVLKYFVYNTTMKTLITQLVIKVLVNAIFGIWVHSIIILQKYFLKNTSCSQYQNNKNKKT